MSQDTRERESWGDGQLQKFEPLMLHVMLVRHLQRAQEKHSGQTVCFVPRGQQIV